MQNLILDDEIVQHWRFVKGYGKEMACHLENARDKGGGDFSKGITRRTTLHVALNT